MAIKAVSKTSPSSKSKTGAKKSAKVLEQPERGGSPRNPEHSSGHKGISRIDSVKRNSHGWYVRVPWNGEMHSRFFSDSAHGGRDSALAKAIRARNRIEREVGKPRTDRVVMLAQQRNESGILGVHKILKQGAPVYEVTWSPEPNVLKRTSVSIRKYGDEGALKRAVAIRRRKEREVFGASIRDAGDNA